MTARHHAMAGLALGSMFLVLMAMPVAAKDNPVKQMSKALPKICAELQKQGWGVSADLAEMVPGTKAEMRMGDVYMCMLERKLAGKGPGRAPDLDALLSSSGDGPSLILSANVWCPADREPAIEALAKEVERVLSGSKIPIPAEVLEAVRAPRGHEAAAEGLHYKVELIEVDAGACERVPPGGLGAVLMKLGVAVEPAP